VTAAGSLPRKLRLSNRRKQLTALGLLAPALLLLSLAFAWPIVSLLTWSVHAPQFRDAMPELAARLERWDGTTLPDEATFALAAHQFAHAFAEHTLPEASTRLNYEKGGMRSLVMKTGRRAKQMKPPYRAAMIALDLDWGELAPWRAMKAASPYFTDHFLLAAVDLQDPLGGSIGWVPPERQIYLSRLGITFWISLRVTLICAAIGYPMAYVMTMAERGWGRLLFILVLLPFWISLLVRTAAWVVLLQKEGILNGLMLALGLFDQPQQLIFNRIGVYVTMVNILLPFFVLPVYSVMKSIPLDHVRAAESLGASPPAAFLTVFFPQTLPGVSAGALLVFVLSIGFYITPALVGGSADQMFAAFIAQLALGTANWSLASALAVVLLLGVALVYPLFARYAGAKRLRIG
jgi:putative spermidine/putrescine transport system permease protein